jgi:prepilin signal peptidase PulO-like enzyme (type II secretory pathway)
LFLRGKHFTMKSEIPFAPFLILGTLAVYLFGIDILGWTL